MKKLLILLVALSLFSASSVFAGTSQENRNDSLISLQYNAFGVHVPTLFAAPFAVSWYANDSIEFGIQKGQTSPLASLAFKNAPQVDSVTFDQVGIYGRFYLGNSFNIITSVEKFNMSISNSFTDVTYGVTITQPFKAEAVIGTIGFGNQWIYDSGVVFGIDWLMLSTSLSGKLTTGTASMVGGTPAQQAIVAAQSVEAAQDVKNNVAIPGVMKFYFGYAF